jgi:uncharacterized membrane protein YedE/YeeE
MDAAALADLQQQVLGLAFLLAFLLGLIAQRTHFCVMGAISDVVLMQNWQRARMWALALAVAMLGVAVLVQFGWLRIDDTLYGGPRLRWASLLLGGLLFGVGMVLASGCGAKTLVRLGGGNLKALVVLLVMGLTGFMTLRGLTAVWRDASVDQLLLTLPSSQQLPVLLGLPAWTAMLPAFLLLAWGLRGPRETGFWLGGIGSGLLVIAMWALSAHFGFVAEHPETLEPSFVASSQNRPESFSFVAPAAGLLDWLLFFSDRSKQLNIGIVALLGVIAGSAASALQRREFRWEGFRQTEDLVNHLIGAALMGVGGVTALGCTFGQGLSGLSTLSLGSLIAVFGLVAGGVLGVRLQLWRAERA